MIFTAAHIKLIREGKKTQTRRLVKWRPDGSKVRPLRSQHVYALQEGLRAKGDGLITITSEPYEEPLGAIGLTCAKAEGYRTITDFRAAWTAIHGGWEPTAVVWVYTFEYGDKRTDLPRLLTRIEPRAASCPRCGHGLEGDRGACPACGTQRRPEDDTDHGYTSRPELALVGAGEEVSEAEQKGFALDALQGVRLSQREQWTVERQEIETALHRFEAATLGKLDKDAHHSIQLMRRQINRLTEQIEKAA